MTQITATVLPSKTASKANLALSVSKAKTFADCKAKYRFCYIEKLPRKEWDFHIFGKFLHQILEDFHIKLIDEPLADVRSTMTECFKQAIEKYSPTQTQKQEAKAIVSNYLNTIEELRSKDKEPKVIGVEKEFYIDIDNKVLLNGFIDRIQVDPDGILHVADYKTTKDKKYLKDYFQLITYSYVLMLEDPSIKHIRASYVLLRHDCEFITKEYSRDEVMKVADKFIKYAEDINLESVWRASPTRLCSYCDYLEHCKEGTAYLERSGLLKPKFGMSSW